MISTCIKTFLSAAVPLVLLTGCGSTTSSGSGTDVHVHVTHEPSASLVAPSENSKRFTTGGSTEVEITQAYLTIGTMDIRTDCSASPFAKLGDSILNVLFPAAYAHTVSSPTSIGEPLVLDIMANDVTEVEFGDFSPAAGSYCGITVHLHPADADARDLPVLVSMTGVVAHIEGVYNTGSGDTSFTVDVTAEPEHADLPFLTDIVLSASNLTAAVDLNIEYDTWFYAINMSSLAAADPAALAAFGDNLTASIHIK